MEWVWGYSGCANMVVVVGFNVYIRIGGHAVARHAKTSPSVETDGCDAKRSEEIRRGNGQRRKRVHSRKQAVALRRGQWRSYRTGGEVAAA